MKAPLPSNETLRLDALRQYRILDTPREDAFDDLTVLAAELCRAPFACVSFIDEKRQWFKSTVGFTIAETSRDIAFCAHAILQPDLFVVPDVLADPRFAGHPLVTAEPKLRFYAGVPLVTPAGHALGTLCVLDRIPRELAPGQREALRVLSRHVMTQLELRRTTAELTRSLADREQAEEALRRSERRYRAIVEGFEDVYLRIDLQGIIEMISPSVARYGYKAESLIGRNVTAFYANPAERARVLAVLAQDGAVRDIEFTLRAQDGTHVPVSSTGHFVLDDSGRRVGIESILRDISQRKQAEELLRRAYDELEHRVGERTTELRAANQRLGTEVAQRRHAEAALRESEARYRTVSELTSDYAYCFRVAGDGALTNEWVTESFLRNVGLGLEEMRARGGWSRFMHPADATLIQEHIRRVLTHGSDVAEFRFVTVQGDTRWVRNYARALRDPSDAATRLIGAAQDITERKGTEDALTQSEVKFRTLAETTTSAILLYQDDHLIYVNPATEAITGYSHAELFGRSLWDIIHPDFHRHVIGRRQARERGEAVPVRSELKIVTKGGEERWVDYTAGFCDFFGQRTGIGTAFDITKRRRAEDERTRLQESLRRSEVMAALGAVVAGVAHEVRNPLFAMSATLDAFEARCGAQTDGATYVTVLRTELGRLNLLMHDLLDYGRPRDIVLAPAHLDVIVSDAVAQCASVARHHHVRIDTAGAHRVPLVQADRTQLCQAVQNLLQNAIQHSPPDAVVVVQTEAQHDAGQTWIACAIEDCGPGFRPEDLPHVFAPFFSRRAGGTGLGLSIVQRIVEAHGGTVAATNRAGGGAVVTIRLRADGTQEVHDGTRQSAPD